MLGIYLVILTAVSILAPFVIEAIKILLGSRKYDVQILSAVTTAVIALISCIAYMVVTEAPWTSESIIYVMGTMFFSVLGALCGYDKMFSIIFRIFRKEN